MRKEGKQVIFDNVDFDSLSYDQLSQMSREDHQEDTHQYDNQQNALCLVMIGAICLVCAVLFFITSFVRKKLQTSSLQFIVCLACLAAAIVLLTIGLIRFFKAHQVRKLLHEEIIQVNKAKMQIGE